MNIIKKNPYVGPRTFLREEGDLFFGRDREASDLLALTISERLVLFYAQSGAGKSSLINTRLIPGLENKGYEVLPVGRVSGDASGPQPAENIFVNNLLRSLVQQEVDATELSLASFLFNLDINDQGYYYDDRPLGEIPDTEEFRPLRRVLVIDQFEELFSTHPEAWETRENFFRELAHAMQEDSYLWVVLVMREDYIAALDPYAHLLPGGLRTRYYMQRLDRQAALQATKSPVEESRPYEEGVAEKLVDDLRRIKVQKPDGTWATQAGQYVEPVQLQVVCYSLWENLSPEGIHITEGDLREIGDVDQTLGRYYEERVLAVAVAKNVREHLIRQWFERKLITAGGIRGLVLQDPTNSNSEVSDEVIQALQSDLVRAEKRAGATWYELTHDRLVEPILENNRSWFEENLSPLQRQAALWNDQGKNESWLLTGRALAGVEEWANIHGSDLSDTEAEFLEASRSVFRRERRARWLTRLIAFMGLLAIGLAVFAYQASLDARRQTGIATARLLAAQAQSIWATGNSKQMTAVLLAIQSMRMFPSIEAVQVLQNNFLALATSSMTHRSRVTSVAFSPDGRYVVSASADYTARVWETASGREIARMTHEGVVTSVAISPDGKYTISGSTDKTARIWETANSREIARMVNEDIVNSVAFSPEGGDVAAGSEIYAHVWDATTGEEKFPIRFGERVTSVTFSPDGAYVAAGSWNHMVQVWEIQTGERVSTMIHDSNVRSVAFSPDGRYVVSGSRDNTARVWDAATGREVARMTHNDTVSSVAFSPDGKFVVSGALDHWVRVWAATASKEIIRMRYDERVWSVAFSPDGKYVISGGGDYTARLWEMTTGHEFTQMMHDDEVFSVAFSPDGSYMVTGSEDHTIRLWETATGQQSAQMNHDDEVFSVAFSPDGKTVVSGSKDNTARIWDAATGREINRLIHDNWVNTVAFSPDGQYVVSGSQDFHIRIWEVSTARVFAQMSHEGNVRTASFSPDGMYVVSGSQDHTVRVWDAATGDEVIRMIHDSNVRTVAFSPDGKYVGSGSSDNTIRIWEWNGTESKEITRMLHDGRLNSIAFSPDGNFVMSGAEDGIVRVWVWHPEDLIEKACSRVTRTLNREEWRLYLGDFEPYKAVCPDLPLIPETIPSSSP